MKSLIEFRTALGLSQRKMAELLEIPYSQLAMYETGKRSLPSKANSFFLQLFILWNASGANTNEVSFLPLNAEETKFWNRELRQAKHGLETIKMELEKVEKNIQSLSALLSCKNWLDHSDLWQDKETSKLQWEVWMRKAGKSILEKDKIRRKLHLEAKELETKITEIQFWLSD